MTAAGALRRLPAARLQSLRAYGQGLLDADDTDLAVRLLAAVPTNEGRDPRLLRRWADSAAAFGARLADADHGPTPEPSVRETDGGLADPRLLLARYVSRPRPSVVLYLDTLALAEELTAQLGWHRLFPPGSPRAAAIAHESAHRLLHRPAMRRGLHAELDHLAVRLGPLRVRGHVAGADEVAAHAFAQHRCGLDRSPLVLTAVLARAVAGSISEPRLPAAAAPVPAPREES